MRVRIVQLLCPSRHCIVAAAYESADGEPDPAMAAHMKGMFDAGVKTGALNPWCGICGSRELWHEDMPTRFQTMEEARPVIEEEERKQAATREMLRAGRN